MVTINNNNVQEYIDKLLIDPYKIKIDLNTSKTTSDNVHRWITLADAIKGGYKFSFDYDIKDSPTEVPTLPEVVVTTLPKMYSVGAGEMKPFNSAAEAAKYAQEHPKKDASEVDTNYLLLGGLGLSRPLGGILLNGVKETLPYFSANGWLLSTLAVGNTPTWLTPRVATAIDAGLAGSATGASMYDWYLNGPSVENVLGTTLGVGGLAFESVPTIIESTNFIKSLRNKSLIPIDYDILNNTGKVVIKPRSKYKINKNASITSPGVRVYKSNFLFNKKLNTENIIDNIISGRAPANFTDLEWDDFFNYVINAKNPLLPYKLRDAHFVVKSGLPTEVWYLGSPYSGHAIFDSSTFNATIGGESAAGRIKGNFLTTDYPSAVRYSLGHTKSIPSFRILSIINEFNKKYPTSRLRRIHNKELRKKIDRSISIHPSDLGALDLKNMHTYTLPIVKLHYKVPHEATPSGIYPLYINKGKTLTLDFLGNPWSMAPYKFPPKYRLIEKWSEFDPETGRLLDKTKIGTETNDLNSLTEYINSLNLPQKFRYDYDIKGNEIIRHFVPFSQSIPKSSYTNNAIYQLHGPSYSVYIEPIYYPSTSNGAVLYGASEGYNTIKIKNIIDSNTQEPEIPYAIDDLIPLESKLMKLAVPITYDDLGVIIPLSKRDNFNNPDIRYKKGGKLIINN